MPTLYITENNAAVRRTGNHLIVTVPNQTPEGESKDCCLLDVKTHHVDTITLVGNTHITSDASQFCLRKGIPITWLAYDGEFLGRMAPALDRNAGLRLSQCARALNPEQCLEFSKTIVAAKSRNGARTLDAIRKNHSKNEVIIKAIKALMKRSTIADKIGCMDKLRGVEGINARIYFDALKEIFVSDISFHGRKKRPAPDPANAMLSLGYTLFANIITGALHARGLDPSIGFYHDPRSGRASMALDILEEFRHPVIDRFVVSLANKRMMKPEHFKEREDQPGAIVLNSQGRKVFFTEWEKRIRTPVKCSNGQELLSPLDLARRQVDHLAQAIKMNTPYEPFIAG